VVDVNVGDQHSFDGGKIEIDHLVVEIGFSFIALEESTVHQKGLLVVEEKLVTRAGYTFVATMMDDFTEGVGLDGFV
jgi:hypothetical protein